MNWKCIETDGLPPCDCHCLVSYPSGNWAEAQYRESHKKFILVGGMKVHSNPTHWVEPELPQDLSVKWPRDWGKVVMMRDSQRAPWEGPALLEGYDPDADNPWSIRSGGPWVYIRLATPEEAGDMKPLTVPDDVSG